MNRLRWVLMLAALLTVSGSAQTGSAQAGPVGSWRAVFVGPIGPQPKMVDAVTFTITATPRGFRGTARASDWPGDLEVSELKVEGNHLTFTGTGKIGWESNRVPHCCPQLLFDGTTEGDGMKLTLTWRSTESPDTTNTPPLPMEAKRVSAQSVRRRSR